MANPFFSGRIPKDLNQRAEEYIAETGKSKTELLISALARYLDFPVELTGVAPKPDVTKEMFASLEDRLEKRMAALEEMVRSTNKAETDNNTDNYVIKNTTPQENLEQQTKSLANTDDQSADNIQTDSVISSDNNPSEALVVYGPVSENQMATWAKRNRNLFRKHRRRLEEKQLPLDTPLHIEVEGKFYQLKCIGGRQGSGRAATKEWIAELTNTDNTDNKNRNLLSLFEEEY